MDLFLQIMRLLPVGILDFIADSAKRTIGSKLAHTEKNRRFWNRVAEPRVLARMASPAVPSASDLAIYHKYVEKNGKESVLVLGSTPKIRELLQNAGINNYVVADFSYNMIENNLRLAKINAIKEVWIKTDWRTLPKLIQPVNCVMGDLIFGQILPDDQPDFLTAIYSILLPNGLFITRNHIVNQAIIDTDPQIIIRECLEKITKDDAPRIITQLSYRLRSRMRNDIRKITSPGDLAQVLLDYKPRDEFERELLRRLLAEILRKSRDGLEYPSQTKNELESKFRPLFEIKDLGFANDYEDSEYFPIYFLVKK